MTLTPRDSRSRRSLRDARGFTLLEIMVVLAIIGLLVALAVSNLGGAYDNARISTADIFVKQSIKTPLFSYKIAMGDFPSTSEGLQALATPPAGKADRWRGPYVQDGQIPLDPWKRPYQYRYPGTHNKEGYDVWSLGPDGQESEDDIGNWTK